MKSLYLLILMLALPIAGWAQDAEEPAEDTAAPEIAAEVVYTRHTATGFGFSVELPPAEMLLSPADEDWSEDANTAFIWKGMPGAPVRLVLARVDEALGLNREPLDAVRFQAFIDVMKSRWVESAGVYELLEEPEPIDNGRFVWHVFDVKQKVTEADLERDVYYTVFSTFAGRKIYTITLYYLNPPSAGIQEFGGPIVGSFELL